MSETVNGYTINSVDDPADWSTKEYNLLKEIASRQPAHGTSLVASQHLHSALVDPATPANVVAATTAAGLAVTGRAVITGDIYTVDWTDWYNTAYLSVEGLGTISGTYWYKKVGKTLHLKVRLWGSSVGTDVTIPVPFALKSPNGGITDIIKPCMVTDNYVTQTTPGMIGYGTSTKLNIYTAFNQAPWTNSGARAVYFDQSFELE